MVLRFAINWSPHIGSRLNLNIATFAGNGSWSESNLDFQQAAQAKTSPILAGGVTYVTRNSWVEFDVNKELMAIIEACDSFQGSQCDVVSFQLSTPDPFWVKLYSKDGPVPEYRPRLLVQESSHSLLFTTVADAGIVKQMKNRGFGWWPTLDLIRSVRLHYLLSIVYRTHALHFCLLRQSC